MAKAKSGNAVIELYDGRFVTRQGVARVVDRPEGAEVYYVHSGRVLAPGVEAKEIGRSLGMVQVSVGDYLNPDAVAVVRDLGGDTEIVTISGELLALIGVPPSDVVGALQGV